ncbi:MAG TPA: DUF6457 domain-containing protein [Acidimicrobiales bacterium]|nr:DUF6457 domain-containing protein [Acidimicrobiales bacterium]
MTMDEFVAAYAEALGTDAPTAHEVEQLLALAGVAAHASERTAAPVTCWLAARAGKGVDDALAVAQSIADGVASPEA